MYKSENANHPWRRISDHAAQQRVARNIGRDMKIGQLLVLLVVLIVCTSSLMSAVYIVQSTQFSVSNNLQKMLDSLDQRQLLLGCAIVILQALFLFLGSKFAYRLLVWLLVPMTLVGLTAVVYLFNAPDTRLLSLILATMFGPYLLCTGILMLSWRAKLYLAYMQREV